jgi:phage-related baseplate assembly protein
MLSLDANGHLSNMNTQALRENITEYLSEYRMINDYVTVNSGKIINLAFEVDLFIEKDGYKIEIINEVINVIQKYLDKSKLDMGTNIYLSQLIENINNVGGVLNVIDIRVYNKVGLGVYSTDEISQPYIDKDSRQIDTNPDFVIYSEPTGMFEIKYPEKDIKVRVKS